MKTTTTNVQASDVQSVFNKVMEAKLYPLHPSVRSSKSFMDLSLASAFMEGVITSQEATDATTAILRLLSTGWEVQSVQSLLSQWDFQARGFNTDKVSLEIFQNWEDREAIISKYLETPVFWEV